MSCGAEKLFMRYVQNMRSGGWREPVSAYFGTGETLAARRYSSQVATRPRSGVRTHIPASSIGVRSYQPLYMGRTQTTLHDPYGATGPIETIYAEQRKSGEKEHGAIIHEVRDGGGMPQYEEHKDLTQEDLRNILSPFLPEKELEEERQSLEEMIRDDMQKAGGQYGRALHQYGA